MILTLDNKEEHPLRKLSITDFRINEIIAVANELINEKRIEHSNIDFSELINEVNGKLIEIDKRFGSLTGNELYFISFLFGLFFYDIKMDIIHFSTCKDPFLCFCITNQVININAQCCN